VKRLLLALALCGTAWAQYTPPAAAGVSLPVSVANGGTGSATGLTANTPWLCKPQTGSGTTYDCSVGSAGGGTITLLDGTAIPSTLLTTPANGQQLIFVPDVTNTGAVTFKIDGTTANAARWWANGAAAFGSGDLALNQPYLFLWRPGQTRWILTPGSTVSPDGTSLAGIQAFNRTLSLANPLTIPGKVSSFNGISTVSGGVPAEYATVDLTAQQAAITSTLLYAPTATGLYRVSYYAKVTTAASVSSILGGTTGLVLTFTDGSDSVAQTAFTLPEDNQAGTALSVGTGNTTNTTQATLQGSAVIFALTGVNITYAFGYTSSGTAMQYELHIKLEAM
jgi:hypothetical protein